MSIIESTTNLYRREQRIRNLCCLMLATLKLKDNQAILPEKLNECADDWQEQFDNILEFHPIPFDPEDAFIEEHLQKQINQEMDKHQCQLSKA